MQQPREHWTGQPSHPHVDFEMSLRPLAGPGRQRRPLRKSDARYSEPSPRREPEPSPGPLPLHLLGPLSRSFSQDHYVPDQGDVVYYQKDPDFWCARPATASTAACTINHAEYSELGHPSADHGLRSSDGCFEFWQHAHSSINKRMSAWLR